MSSAWLSLPLMLLVDSALRWLIVPMVQGNRSINFKISVIFHPFKNGSMTIKFSFQGCFPVVQINMVRNTLSNGNGKMAKDWLRGLTMGFINSTGEMCIST